MAREILDLGFDALALGPDLPSPAVAELLEARRALGFSVACLECYCSLPPEPMGEDHYELVSHRAGSRERAIQLSCRTIEMAAKFGARSVIVRTGKIRTSRPTAELKEIAGRGCLMEKDYARTKMRRVIRRMKQGEAYLQRLLESLHPIVDHASSLGIRVAITNGALIESVPAEDEVENLLRRLDCTHAEYWHDFSAAQIKSHLGLLDHRQWLEQIGHSCGGAWLSDVRWPFDGGAPPYAGVIDFDSLLAILPAGIPKVVRVAPGTPAGAIAAARQRLTLK